MVCFTSAPVHWCVNLIVYLGEFGPIYEKKEYNPDWQVHNDERYDMLDRQLAIYTSEEIGKQVVLLQNSYVLANGNSLEYLGLQGYQCHGNDVLVS